MKFIPLIYMNDRKIYPGKTSDPISIIDFLKQAEKIKKIYILDLDGVEQDKPNLCTYQRLAGQIDFWVDSGPRDKGDVVDATMSGATDITLRKKLCPNLQVSEIKEISENKIYEKIDFNEEPPFNDIDGFVNFNRKEEIEGTFEYRDKLKKKSANNSIYSYENELKNLNYWKHFNVEGLLVDFNKVKEFKNAL